MNRTARFVTAIAIGVLLLSLLTLAVLPYWFGLRAEKNYRALLDELALATGLPVTLKRYERGWRHSEAEADIALPDLPLTLTVRHALQHGPWTENGWAPLLARVRGDVRFASTANYPVPESLTWQGDIDVRGTVRLSFDWPATQFAWAGGNLQWRPVRGTLLADRDGNRVQAELSADELRLGGWRAERGRARLDVRPNEAAFPLGQLYLDIGRLASPSAWEADALQLSLSSRLTGETVALKLGGQLEKLRIAEKSYGPGELAFEARNLESVALTQFVRALPALFRADASVAAVPPLAALARKAPEAELVTLRLKASPESTTAPNRMAGRASEASRASESARGPRLDPIGDALAGRGSIVLDGRRLGATPHPARLLSALSGELTLSISTPLLTSWSLADTPRDTGAGDENNNDQKRHLATQALPDYLATHPYARLLAAADGHYRLVASLKQGRLLVNNEPWHGLLPNP